MKPKIKSDDLFQVLGESLQSAVIATTENHYLHPKHFLPFIVEDLEVDFTEKQIQCLLHILVREDLQNVILFEEVSSMLKNFEEKESMHAAILQSGIKFQILTHEALEDLVKIKSLLEGDLSTILKDITYEQVVKSKVKNSIAKVFQWSSFE